uniref:(California timema) hypothetical protein n=1 Tax=Timema californicum TaxID=61474 RepID=A0A7R9PDB1_TIMCA|nr:unnamed protein product [Timema californicum]
MSGTSSAGHPDLVFQPVSSTTDVSRHNDIGGSLAELLAGVALHKNVLQNEKINENLPKLTENQNVCKDTFQGLLPATIDMTPHFLSKRCSPDTFQGLLPATIDMIPHFLSKRGVSRYVPGSPIMSYQWLKGPHHVLPVAERSSCDLVQVTHHVLPGAERSPSCPTNAKRISPSRGRKREVQISLETPHPPDGGVVIFTRCSPSNVRAVFRRRDGGVVIFTRCSPSNVRAVFRRRDGGVVIFTRCSPGNVRAVFRRRDGGGPGGGSQTGSRDQLTASSPSSRRRVPWRTRVRAPVAGDTGWPWTPPCPSTTGCNPVYQQSDALDTDTKFTLPLCDVHLHTKPSRPQTPCVM